METTRIVVDANGLDHVTEVLTLKNIAGQTHYRSFCHTCEVYCTTSPVFFFDRNVVERHGASHAKRASS